MADNTYHILFNTTWTHKNQSWKKDDTAAVCITHMHC